jgi:hypothetical protein
LRRLGFAQSRLDDAELFHAKLERRAVHSQARGRHRLVQRQTIRSL